jgi:hypothetical protein
MKDENNKLKIEYFVGATKPTSWSSVYFYAPQAPSIYEAKGEIVACISLASPPSFDSDKAGNLLLDELHEVYFESEEQNTLLALEKACLNTRKRLLELLKYDEISSEKGLDFNLSVAVIKDSSLFMVCIGDAKILGYREGEYVDLSDVLKDPDGRSSMKVGSLDLQSGDKFLLLTPRAREELTDTDLEKVFSRFSIESLEGKNFFVESLVSLILVGYELPSDSSNEISINNTSLQSKNLPKRSEFGQDDFEGSMLAAEGDVVAEEKLVAKHGIFSKLNTKNITKFFSNLKDSFGKISRDPRAKTFQVVFVGAILAVWKFLQKAGSYVWKDLLKMGNKSNVYLRGAKKQTNFRPIIFFLCIALVLGYFIVSSVKEKRIKQKLLADAELVVSQSERNFDSLEIEARTLITTYSRAEEKEALFARANDLKRQLSVVEIEDVQERKLGLLSKIDDVIDKLLRKVSIENLDIFVDFGVIEGADPNDISIFVPNLFVSDGGNGVIYKFDMSANRETVIDSLNKPKALSTNDFGEVVFFDYNTERAIGTVKIEEKSLNRVRGLSFERVGELSQLVAYKVADGDHRLYGIREGKNQFIQMTRSGDDYGLPIVRFEDINFADLRDVALNNRWIYLVSKGEGVRRFFGVESETNIHGMIQGDNWNSVSSIFVDERFIYLGDSDNRRVLVFTKSRGDDTKNLDFVAQFDLSSDPVSSSIKGLVADEDHIFVLAGTKIIKLAKSNLQGFTY